MTLRIHTLPKVRLFGTCPGRPIAINTHRTSWVAPDISLTIELHENTTDDSEWEYTILERGEVIPMGFTYVASCPNQKVFLYTRHK